MHDAEEEVPSRVWSSVSSRLDAAAAPTSSPVWRWAGIGLAFAALATGIFFIGTSDRSREVAAPSQIAEAVENVEFVQSEAGTFEGNGPSLVAEARIPEVRKAAAVIAVTPSEDALVTVAEPAIPEGQAVVDEPATAEESATAVEKQYVTEEPQADPFAAIEMEQHRMENARKAQLTFNGSVGGNGSRGLGSSSMSSGSPIAPSTDVITETSNSSYGIPFTIGVGIRFNIIPRLYIGTGIDYSLLTRTFDGTFTAAGSYFPETGSVRNNIHYIGIPVRVFYDVVDNQAIKFYAYGGFEGELCVSNRLDFRPTAGGETRVQHIRVPNPQFSIGAGIGVQFRLTDQLGLYLDPGVNYYFYCSQPKSIRTERPLMMNFNAGLRFNL